MWRKSYTAAMAGETLATGSLREMQAAVMEVVTGFLAEDPEGVAAVAQTANSAFQDGTVESEVASTGQWVCLIPVHGDPKILTVTRRRKS